MTGASSPLFRPPFGRAALLNAALALLTAVTAWSTFDGLRRMMGGGAEADTAGALLIPAGVTFGLSMALVVTADRVASAPGPGRRLVWLGGYLMAALVTTSLAFAFWWTLFRAAAVTEDAVRSGIDAALAAAHQADTRLRTLQATLDALASHSAERARVEQAQGGTCGGAPKAGNGPRRRLREADAALFAGLAADVGQRTGDVAQGLAGFARMAEAPAGFAGAEETVRQVRAAAARANALAGDPLLATVRGMIQTRLDQGRSGFPDGAGGTFSCTDPALEARLTAALSAAALPPMVLPDMDVAKGAAATFLAYRRLGGEIRSWLAEVPSPPRFPTRTEREEERRRQIRAGASPAAENGPEQAGAALTADDIVPLGLSLVIEALILALSLLKERPPLQRLRAHLDGVPELPAAYPAHLLEGLSGSRLAALSAFLSYSFRDGPDRCIALPLSVRTEEVSALTLILDLWEHDGLARRIAMPTRRVRTLLARQASPWAGESAFLIYRLFPGLLGRLAADTLRHWTRDRTPSSGPAGIVAEPGAETSHPTAAAHGVIVLPPRREDEGPRWKPFRPDWRDPSPGS